MKVDHLFSDIEKLVVKRDRKFDIESKVTHSVSSLINVIELLEKNYEPEEVEELMKKIFLSIKSKNINKFIKKFRELTPKND